MKNITILILLICSSFTLNSQNKLGKSDDEARIVLNTFIPETILQEAPSARKLFMTKLSQIATRNGMGGNEASPNNRFIISGDINVLTKDILPTAPPKYSVTIELNLAVGDGVDGTLFASEYIEFKGIGVSEDKAFISAIRKINPRHKMIKEVIVLGKEKIIEYYNSKCDFIQKEAESLAKSRKFDEALLTLNQVPEATKDCYIQSMDLAAEIAENKFEFECKAKIAEARSHWANRDAKSAAVALSGVNALSSCYPESIIIFKEISGFLDEKDKRERELAHEKYKDSQGLENRKLDNAASLIKAARDVGVAYGKNQPRTIRYRSIF